MIPPASTGRDRRSKIVVISKDQANKGSRRNVIPLERKWIIVVIKLIEPRIDLAPARCRDKIPHSTLQSEWKRFLDNGGYTVHPVPNPVPINALVKRRRKEGGKSQNLKLFSRGKAISGDPSIRGNSQFPNPPIKIGITIKKIITKAWEVIIVLYNWP